MGGNGKSNRGGHGSNTKRKRPTPKVVKPRKITIIDDQPDLELYLSQSQPTSAKLRTTPTDTGTNVQNEPEVHNQNDTIELALGIAANTETVKSDLITESPNASHNESLAFLVNMIGSKKL